MLAPTEVNGKVVDVAEGSFEVAVTNRFNSLYEVAVNLDVALFELQTALLAGFLAREAEEDFIFTSNIETSLVIGKDVVVNGLGAHDLVAADQLALVLVSGSSGNASSAANSSAASELKDYDFLQSSSVRPNAEFDLRQHVLEDLVPTSPLGPSVDRFPDAITATTFGNDEVGVWAGGVSFNFMRFQLLIYPPPLL